MEGEPNGNFMWRKVVVVGNHQVGKTTLIKRFCEEKFNNKYQPTIGADYGHKRCVVNGKEVDVTFWDLAGGKEFYETRKHLYADTQICLIVCEASDISHESIQEWIRETSKHGVSLQQTAVLVNKVDICNGDSIQMVADKLASSFKMRFFLVSACTGEGVANAFLSMLSV